jgi:hypothetical protein
VPAGPPAGSLSEWLGARDDRFVGESALDVVSEGLGGCVAFGRLLGHGLEADGFEGLRDCGVEPAGWLEIGVLHLAEDDAGVGTVEGRFAGEEAAERGTERRRKRRSSRSREDPSPALRASFFQGRDDLSLGASGVAGGSEGTASWNRAMASLRESPRMKRMA